MRAKWITATIVVIGILLMIYSAVMYHSEGYGVPPDVPNNNFGYTINDKEIVPREIISSFIVDNGLIYVFYESTALVNVYSTEGAFMYGIRVSSIQNGRGDIAVKDGILHIASRTKYHYEFDKTDLIRLTNVDASSEHSISNASKETFSTEKNHAENGANYILEAKENRIIIEESGSIVLDFPKRSHAGDIAIIALLILGLSPAIYKKLYSHN